jgi:hypothetical protein
MAWVSGYIRFHKPPEQQSHFKGDIILKRAADLVLHGVITKADSRTPVPGALIKVFARSPGGREVPLSHSYSGGDGRYLLSIKKDGIPAGTAAIIIRAMANDFEPD